MSETSVPRLGTGATPVQPSTCNSPEMRPFSMATPRRMRMTSGTRFSLPGHPT